MKKRIFSLVICLAMIVAMMPAMALVPERVSAAPYVMPSHNGATNNTSYTLGKGTDAEVPVYVDFRSSLSTKSFSLKYIMIHNTGTYVGTGTAKNVHTNTNKTSSSACWHYTVDEKSIYQGVPDKKYAFHAGTSRSTTPSSANALGIEMCVNYFPATETFGGEKWNDGTAIMKWYEDRFNQTMKNTAYLVAVLCARHGLDYKTAVKMHYDALQYDPATNYGKDCPMQMRATYDEATNTFKKAGYYKKGRDGYFWQIFWSYLEQYAAGAQTVDNPFDTTKQTVTFESNGGSYVAPVKVKNGEPVAEPAAPSKYAFDFGGWYCNPELTDRYDFNTPVPYDFTLYAKWNEQYWGAQTNLMPNSTQIQLHAYNDQDEKIWPYWNDDAYGSVTMYNGVDDEWSWPSASMQYENSFDSYNDSYLYVKKDGTAEFNVVLTYLDKNGEAHDLHLSSVAGLDGDFPAGPLENFYDVGSHIRNLGHAPDSGNIKFTRVLYYVVGKLDSYVKLYDLKLTSKFAIADPYQTMMSSEINQISGAGSYSYSDGVLQMTSNSDNGYTIKMDVYKTINPAYLQNLLMDIDADAPFNISFELTNAEGNANMQLKNEFFNEFGMEGENFTSLPAGNWNVDMNLIGYYEWNGGAVTESTIKTVTITIVGKGSLTLKALQTSSLDNITYIQDGAYSNGSLAEEADGLGTGDVDGSGMITTADARIALQYTIGSVSLTDAQLAAADYNGDGAITTADARDILISTL